MTDTAGASVRHRMTVHRTALPGLSRALFTCCTETDSPFSVFWNPNTTSRSPFPILGTPSEVINQIVDHVIQGHADTRTVETAQAVRVMVGLSDDVADGIKMLGQELDYTTLEFRCLEPSD